MTAQLEFNSDAHEYHLDGRRLVSVTQIIRTVLPAFQANEYYLQRGRALHHATALLDDGKLDWSTVDEAILGRTRAWQKFRRDYPASTVAIEQKLVSKRYRFAGTADRVLFADECFIIADAKSTVAPQCIPQMGLYSLLWTENGGKPCRKAVAVELQDDEQYRCMWLSHAELRAAEQTGLAVLTVHNFALKHGIKERQ